MNKIFQILTVLSAAAVSYGCGGSSQPVCSSAPASKAPTSLSHYDQMSSAFLDETTRHPIGNLGGQVVWNSRWYLESLITAYQATSNPKYATAFVDSGTWILNMAQPMTILNVKDPSAPGQTATGPLITETGWATYMATFGKALAIPTDDGRISLYAQSLYPRGLPGPSFAVVTPQSDGTIQFSWWRGNAAIQTFTLHSVADLYAIAAQPLVYGQTPARLKPTGLGMPAQGKWQIDTPLTTIWHGEQTGGILSPFVKFLLLAKKTPNLIDPATANVWEAKILSIASEYEDQFVSDGAGGLIIRNAQWMPSTEADLVTEADYAYAEAILRILLYELTSDSHELAIAQGLVKHNFVGNWQTNDQGWLLLKNWPDIQPWTSRSQGPAGSIWDSLSYDPDSPELSSAGLYFNDLLSIAENYKLSDQLGLSAIGKNDDATLNGYIRVSKTKSGSLIRANYPTAKSNSSDNVDPDPDIFADMAFLYSGVVEDSFVSDNWNSMLDNGTNPNGDPVGYFLLGWARSEAAVNDVCSSAQ